MRIGACREQHRLRNGPAPGLSARNKPKNGAAFVAKSILALPSVRPLRQAIIGITGCWNNVCSQCCVYLFC